MAGTTDLERLLLSMSADFKAYEKAWAKAQGTTATNIKRMEKDAQAGANRIQASMNKAASALAGFGKGLAVGAVLAGVAGIEQLVTGAVQASAAIGDLSDKLGISATKLQELQYGAVQANLGFDEMESGLLKFSKALAQAQSGQGDLLKTLEANGFSRAQIDALSYSEALDDVSDLIANAKNEQDALLITLQAFGKGGDGFVELLRNGSSGLKDFARDAHNAGAIVSEDLVKSAQAFDDAWSAALLSIKAGISNFVLGAIPYIQSFDKAVSDSADSLGLMLGTLTPEKIAARNPIVNTLPLTPGNSTGKGSINNSGGTKIYDPEVAAAAKKAADERLKSYENEQKAISGVMSALKFEREQLTASDLQREINIKLREAGVTAASKEGKAIAELTTANFKLAESQETAITKGEEYVKAQEQFQSSLMNLAEIGVDAFDAVIVGGEKAEDVLKNLVKQLASAAIQATLLGQGPLAGLFGTATGGGLFGALFGGFRAGGGQVSAGKSYVVGEKRAEVFTPTQSGTISPKVSSGGMSINFAPVVDARGASIEAVEALSYRLDEISRGFANNVKNIVSNEKAKNPRFAT